MTRLARIPTPLNQHLRRFRYQGLPVVVFACLLMGLGALWNAQQTRLWAIGEAHVVTIDVTAPADGVLSPIPFKPEPLAKVREGDIIVQLDNGALEAEVEAMRGDLAAFLAQVEATEAELALDEARDNRDELLDLRRLALDVQRHELDILDRRAQLQTDRIELLGLEAELSAAEDSRTLGAETDYNVENLRSQCQVARQRVYGGEAALERAIAQLEELSGRLESHGDLPDTDPRLDALLAPLRQAVVAQKARVRQLECERDALTLRSPIDGEIAAIYRRPGQAVALGEVIMTIVSTEPSVEVVSYVREGAGRLPQQGDAVRIQPRNGPRKVVTGTVVRVGAGYVAVPPRQLRDQQQLEWGLPVRITINEPERLRPGELVNVAYVAAR
ncbi:MAG: HlyD family efflux transporter periplasmic adaptor subunit [Planctomycetes bacterium]|nr:HlyD family efflux transporter periplasmic adaptor subunit [Planctomycetota bacterium]